MNKDKINDNTHDAVNSVISLVQIDNMDFPDLNISCTTNLVDNIYDKNIDKMYENIINKM